MKNKNAKIDIIIGLYPFLLHISCSLYSLRLTAPYGTFYQLSMAAFLVAIFIISLLSLGCKAATYLVSGANVAALPVCRNDYSNLNTYNVWKGNLWESG